MKRFKVNENDEGQRLNRFIEKVFLKVPKSLIYKLIRKKEIKVNFKRSTFDYILKKDDVVEVFGLDEFFKKTSRNICQNTDENLSKKFKLDVIFEDENILVVNKQRGIKTQPNSKKKDSLIDLVIEYLSQKKDYEAEKQNSFTPAFCTRLDMNTKGLVVAGKNAKALRTLNELTAKGRILKTYFCSVEGVMEKKSETLVGFWTKDFRKNIVKITKNKRQNSKKVITKYFVVKQFFKTANLKILLLTGRSHQIRAHMQSIGHPIVGDFKYGSSFKKKLQLICCGLEFDSKNSFLDYLNGKKITLPRIC